MAKTTSLEICVFSIKLMKSVVSFKNDSCFCGIGCNGESTKLEICSVGPLQLTGIFLWIFVSVQNSGMRFWLRLIVKHLSHCVDIAMKE